MVRLVAREAEPRRSAFTGSAVERSSCTLWITAAVLARTVHHGLIMPRQHPADLEFPHQAFLVRDALRRGYSPGVFAHARWQRPFHGVRTKAPLAESQSDRALQYLPRLKPGERFNHLTALALLDCPIRVLREATVHVSTPLELGWVECAGVTGHRHQADSPEYPCLLPEYNRPIPVAAPLLAVQQSANMLPFFELVVALDTLLLDNVRRYDPYLRVHPETLARFAGSASGRGAVRFRAAAATARVGAESRMETLIRLGAVRVGMPELRLQADLRDQQGAWIGRFDAVDEATRSIFEYDGEQHFYSRRQRRRDPKKHQAARDAGWRILVFYSEDLAEGALDTGRRMLEFSGRKAGRVPVGLARLLDETWQVPNVSAHPVLPARYFHS